MKNIRDRETGRNPKKLSKTGSSSGNPEKSGIFPGNPEDLATLKVTLPNDPSFLKTGSCNCPSFFNELICKHVIGLAIRLNYCKPPPTAKDVKMGEKRKRGRPKKATKALITK